MSSDTTPTGTTPTAPNHHADHPGFSGLGGLLAGLSMTVGRGADAELALGLTRTTSVDHVVDVGCGPGTAARRAARRGARVTGVEPAPVMRRLARLLTRRDPSPEWVDGIAEHLPIGDGEATVIWSIATVHHWSNVAAGLAEAHRALAPGGRLLALERRRAEGSTGHASHGWTEAQADAFVDACRSAGFIDVEVSEHPGRRNLLAVRARRP